jgi:hypothetical protein
MRLRHPHHAHFIPTLFFSLSLFTGLFSDFLISPTQAGGKGSIFACAACREKPSADQKIQSWIESHSDWNAEESENTSPIAEMMQDVIFRWKRFKGSAQSPSWEELKTFLRTSETILDLSQKPLNSEEMEELFHPDQGLLHTLYGVQISLRQLENRFFRNHLPRTLKSLQVKDRIREPQDLVRLDHALFQLAEEFKELVRLDLSGLQTPSLSALCRLTELKELNLARTHISDVTLLLEFSALETLDLTGSRVSDLSVLTPHPSLKEVYVRKNQLTPPRREPLPLKALSAWRQGWTRRFHVFELDPR